jgi:hypothetical protein
VPDVVFPVPPEPPTLAVDVAPWVLVAELAVPPSPLVLVAPLAVDEPVVEALVVVEAPVVVEVLPVVVCPLVLLTAVPVFTEDAVSEPVPLTVPDES